MLDVSDIMSDSLSIEGQSRPRQLPKMTTSKIYLQTYNTFGLSAGLVRANVFGRMMVNTIETISARALSLLPVGWTVATEDTDVRGGEVFTAAADKQLICV